MDVSEMFPMNWRFLPTLDPQVALITTNLQFHDEAYFHCQVDIMMSRDLDSRINLREAAAVQEWLDSGSVIHSMRHVLILI